MVRKERRMERLPVPNLDINARSVNELKTELGQHIKSLDEFEAGVWESDNIPGPGRIARRFRKFTKNGFIFKFREIPEGTGEFKTNMLLLRLYIPEAPNQLIGNVALNSNGMLATWRKGEAWGENNTLQNLTEIVEPLYR